MSPPFGVTPSETLPSGGRVHVIGAGPVCVADPLALLGKLHIY